METVVVAAVVVLSLVFLGSLLSVVLLCRRKYRGSWPDAGVDDQLVKDVTEVELDDVQSRFDIDSILADDRWIDDATGLIPHCLAILKKCRRLTENLVAMTSVSKSGKQLDEIVEVAKRIGPRIDDVVQSMYPPLDPRLLEARCAALILSVTHLALVSRVVCRVQSDYRWIEETLSEMEEHVQILREAGLAVEAFMKSQANFNPIGIEHQQISPT
ncbi:transmembrane protein 98-like [Centruroides vittatus]|uniref:transmembrane protein 98-like n=1 Tax=Centruroides vittatus TaxID=120091 RepID=UPI0035101BA1